MKHKIIDSQFPCKILVKLGLLLCIHFSQNTIIWMSTLYNILLKDDLVRVGKSGDLGDQGLQKVLKIVDDLNKNNK